MAVSVGVLDHFNLRTRKLADTVRFYESVLGLEKGPRPNFGFPGAWMYSEGKAVVHLVDISATDEPQKPDSGVVHHVAFASTGFDGMADRLKSRGMPFDARQVPGVGVAVRIAVGDVKQQHKVVPAVHVEIGSSGHGRLPFMHVRVRKAWHYAG